MNHWNRAEDYFKEWCRRSGLDYEDWSGPPYRLLTPDRLTIFCEWRGRDLEIPRSELRAAEKEMGAINIPDFRLFKRCSEHKKHYLTWVDVKYTQHELRVGPGLGKLHGYATTSRVTGLPAILVVYRGEGPELEGWYQLSDRDELALEAYVVDNKDIQALRDFLSALVTCRSARAGLK